MSVRVKTIKSIDLFAGCGGLMEGFEASRLYTTLAAVEWEKAPCENLKKRLEEKWQYKNAEDIVLRFDIQRTQELFSGWSDEDYGTSKGLDYIIEKNKGIDVIIGGPPCQAYSIAGRVRDEHGMRNDYRNYLFESYLEVVKRYRPKLFVFENVPGLLSAKPGDRYIVDIIKEKFDEAGYQILNDLKKATIDFTEYGVPQNRKRIIIIGLDKFSFQSSEKLLEEFYKEILPRYKSQEVSTVRDAIGNLPKLFPINYDIKFKGKRTSYTLPEPFVCNHIGRWHSERDKKVFKLLTQDIESGRNKYTSTQSLRALYKEITGRDSNVHKYYVLRWNQPSNLIPAHLYKDGLRHIHPDSQQARTITVREAARLQTFSDDYIFLGSNTETYKMIGNAVPPLFSQKLALAIKEFLEKYSNII